MKKKPLFTLASVIVLLTSCGNSRPLRSDIQKFIASFSLRKSMEEYQEVDYEEHWSGYKNKVYENKNIDLSFNIKDQDNPSYFFHETYYIDNVLQTEITRQIVKENEQLFYIENEEKTPCTYAKCQELVTKFFYTTEAASGLYHSGGMYYGDYLTEMARDLQDLIVIDQEKSLLIFDRHYEIESEDNHETLTHKYSVDELGMLQSFEYRHLHNDDYVDQFIEVSKK